MTETPIGANTLLAERYRLTSEIGRGGMGLVFRAHDEVLDRDVAVKIIAGREIDTAGRTRLLQEARAAARLNHPNIVAVYDAGETAGTPYIVMELVNGRDLREMKTLPLETAREIAVQLCEALAHVHDLGIVHRDIKPANVLLVDSPESVIAKLADLGVARLDKGSCITADGVLIGTPAYLAPEQALGDDVDGRADLYSLGALLYEIVVGRPPFTGDDPLVVVSEHLHAPVIPPATFRPDLPPDFEAIVLRLLAKKPGERFQNAREAGDALRAVVMSHGTDVGPPDESTATTVSLLAQLARGRLVGRRSELAGLRELWSRARKGEGGMALISGEPGVGKTRLANEILVYARLSGALVLRGGCYEFEATTPYLPFVEALRGWVRGHTADTLRREIGSLAPELARLAPEIDNLLGPLPPNPPLSPNEEKLRLFDHIARFLHDRAESGGVLLFLDDLHWADQGTLSLLHYLLRQTKNDRVLFLGAYREVELDRAHPLASALVEWNRDHLTTRYALGRLTGDETSALLATLFGQETVSPDFAGALFRETEGNPFFIEEVVKSLIEQGQIYREGGQWQRGEVKDLAIPQSVKEAIGRRLNNVGAACMEVLHSAAALGKTFEFNELAAVLTLTEDAILDALDEASKLQLLRAEQGEAFSFTHDKIREVLYEEQNPIRRRRLHLRIGEGLLKLHAGSIEDRVQELAYHFINAGNLEKGCEYAERAAVQAGKIFALDESLRYYEQALECAESLGSGERKQHILGRIGAVQLSRGYHLVAAGTFEKSLELTQDPARRAVLKMKIGECYAATGHRSGPKYIEEAMAELNPETQAVELAEALTVMGRYCHYLARHRESIEFLEKARAIIEPIGDPHKLAYIYAYLAGAYQQLALFPKGLMWAQRNIDMGGEKNHPLAAAMGHEFMAEILSVCGNRAEAIKHTLRNRAIGTETNARDRVAWSHFAEGFANNSSGRLRETVEALETCLALARTIGESRLEVNTMTTLAVAVADLGEIETALELARASIRSAGQFDQLYLNVLSRSALAHVHMARDEWTEAAELHRQCMDILGDSEHRISRVFMEADRIETLVRLDRLDDARAAAHAYLEIATASGSPFLEGQARRMLGIVHAARGETAEALRSIEDAFAILRPLDSWVELGMSHQVRGELHRRNGDGNAARDDFQRAIEWFEKSGSEVFAGRARRDLASVP